MVIRMQRWIRHLLSKRTPKATHARLEADHVILLARGQEVGRFHWAEVDAIKAWNQNAGFLDFVVLRFELIGRDMPVDLSESLIGFKDLVEAMQSRLQGYRRDWLESVAAPPFSGKCVVVWRANPSEETVTSAAPTRS
jgi:hypothetical protein